MPSARLPRHTRKGDDQPGEIHAIKTTKNQRDPLPSTSQNNTAVRFSEKSNAGRREDDGVRIAYRGKQDPGKTLVAVRSTRESDARTTSRGYTAVMFCNVHLN